MSMQAASGAAKTTSTLLQGIYKIAEGSVRVVTVPIGLALRPFIWIAKIVTNDRYDKKEDKGTLFSYLMAWALSVYSLVVLANYKNNNTFWSICIVLGIVACAALGNKVSAAAVPAVAVSIEILLEVYKANTLSQLITTVSVFALVCVLVYFEDYNYLKVNVQYTFVWTIYRLVRAMQLNTSPASQWRLSQVFIFVMICVHLLRRFVPRDKTGSSDHMFWVIAASGETIINSGLLVAVLLLYDETDVLPWKINMALLVVPLAYVAAATLPAETQPYVQITKAGPSRANRVAEFLAGCVAVAAATGAFVYDRPTDAVAPQDDTCNPSLTNLHTCTSANEANRFFVTGQCCMPAGYMIVPSAVVARAALEDICRPTLTQPGVAVDCCGAERSKDTEALMSGAYACMCNQNPEYDNGNRLVDGACQCNTDLFDGLACETMR